MTVKIFIKRKVSENNSAELQLLLTKLRSMTLSQPGYISGETLKRIDVKDESMVISTWQSVAEWNNWVNNETRMAIQTQIDQLLGSETEYAIYEG